MVENFTKIQTEAYLIKEKKNKKECVTENKVRQEYAVLSKIPSQSVINRILEYSKSFNK